jgi:hypothetical protein
MADLEDRIAFVLGKTKKTRPPLDPHHPKVVAKFIADALKRAKAGKVKVVELKGSTIDRGVEFRGVKHSVIHAPWTGHDYIILEVTPTDDEPYRVAISISWAQDERPEYSGSASADLRGTIPLYRFSTLDAFLRNAASELSSWLGKKRA